MKEQEQQYVVIKHRSPDMVAQRVSEAMDRGYMPYGNLFYSKESSCYVQALIKQTRKEENNGIQ